MEKGVVEWFDRKLGYGFIGRDDGEDIFVHFSKVIDDGRGGEVKYLECGDEVEFEARLVIRRNSNKKMQAFDVRVVRKVAKKDEILQKPYDRSL